MKKILILGVVFALFTSAASAQQRGDAVQRHRTEKGFQSGELNRGEKFNLNKDNGRYTKAKRKAMRDGRFTRAEKRKFHAWKRHGHRKTFAMKHNHRRRAF